MEYSDQVKNRVKRMEGQLRGILKMMEEEKTVRQSLHNYQQYALL